MAGFPSTITSFSYPTPTDKLSSPSHSTLENTQSSAIGQLQAFIGTESSAVGTLQYDIRSTDSNGGGHIQSANKGGTGQTSYAKGDILVATSSSVIAKLAAGVDNQVLTANSSVAAGMYWGVPSRTKIAISGSVAGMANNTVAETSIMSVTIPASTLGASNAVRAKVFVNVWKNNTASSVLLKANYGSNQVASVLLLGNPADVTSGTLDFTLLANNSVSSQVGFLQVNLGVNKNTLAGHTSSMIQSYVPGVSSVNSDDSAILGITARFSDIDAGSSIVINGYTVEKII